MARLTPSSATLPRAVVLLAACALPVMAFAGFKASSHKQPSRSAASPYQPSAALDSNAATAWIVDPEKGSKAAWIYIDVPMGKVDKLEVIVGWNRDAETWGDYDRLKTARIEVIDLEKGTDGEVVHEQTVSFEDVKTPQVIDLPDIQVGGEMQGGRVKLIVEDVYQGQDFEYLALGEMLVVMNEFEAMTVNITTPPSSEAEGHDAMMMLDDSTRSFWASEGAGDGATLELDGGRYSVSSIGLTHGPKTHARAKTVKVTQSGVTLTHTLADKTGPQWLRLPALVGYTGSAVGSVSVEIVDTYPGSSTSAVAISEVDFRATMLELF